MIKRALKIILPVVLFVSLCLTGKLQAQAPANIFSNITVSSPNAASLGKYGDYPVSYNTGLPQISIPIYTVKEGPLSLPVSISYHSAGLKVMETSSWVGAGWALNAGGVITRTVVGAADDKGYLSNVTHGHFSNYGYNGYLFVGSTGSGGCYPNPNGNTVQANDLAFINGTKDGEPDLFFFNFNGYSGKFYFRDDRMPVLVPEADFKIEPVTQYATQLIVGFVITATDGTKYYFGKNQNGDGNIDALEKTEPYTAADGLAAGGVYSAWYLNKIISADNQFSIVLIYQAEKYSYYTISMYPVADDDVTNKHTTLVKNYIDGVKLSRVNFSNGNVNLSAIGVRTDLGEFQTKTINDFVNTESKSLDTIKITDNEGYCKNFILYHSYFTDNTTTLSTELTGGLSITTDTKRLRLDSIKEKICDNSQYIPAYTFTYTIPSGTFAPRRLSFGQDHWGYYNGKTTNAGLIPGYTLNTWTKFAGADRESSWPEMSYGSLNKITYPTGGYTQFNFEPNDVWLSYPYYEDSLVATASIGPFYGTYSDQDIPETTTLNHYKFVLDFYQNSPGASTGTVSINGLVISANKATPHGELIFVPGAGAQTYKLHQLDMQNSTGDYATAKLYEIKPKTFTGNKIIGGLRIKSMVNNNGTANDSATYYNYRSGSQSTGVLYSRPMYVRVLRNEGLRQVGIEAYPPNSFNGCINPDGGLGYKKSPSSLRIMETAQGNHIGYNTVEVSRPANGKTQYKYYGSDLWDANLYYSNIYAPNVNNTTCDTNFPNWPDAPLPFEFMRGELKYEAYYNQAGNLLKDVFYYPVYEESTVTTPAYIARPGALTFYNLNTSRKIKATAVSSEYLLTGGIITITDSSFYESPYHHQVTRKISINSKGEKTETKVKYAFDFQVPNCEAISDCWQSYNAAYNNTYSTYSSGISTCSNSGNCNCKFPIFQQFRYDWSIARKNYVTCRRAGFMDSLNAFKKSHDSVKAIANTEFKPVLELQDKYINAPIETTVWKSGKLMAASYTKYDYATNPANNVYPSKQQEIKLSVPSSTFTVATSSNTAITKDNRYKEEATLKFHAGNVQELKKKDEVTYSYLWNYGKNQPVAQVVSGAASDIAYTSFEADSTGNFTYAAAKTADQGSPTGKYCYSLGSGAVQRTGLTSGKSYILSYWCKTGASVTVSAGSQTNIVTGATRNSWTLKQLQFTGTTSATISGTGYIDEVRIYPLGAFMTTYTYNPLVGMTSSCDPNNKITYYEFDKFARLKNVKDQNRNITQSFLYNYGAAPTSPPVMVSFKANNNSSLIYTIQLTSKTTGEIINFTVPAGVTNYILGSIPSDTYDMFINYDKVQGVYTVYFQVCSYSTAGLGANFYNIAVTASTCNTVIMDTSF
ncbi:MAG: hypothetical protein QM791_18535 [Ferruginibacter sp.]